MSGRRLPDVEGNLGESLSVSGFEVLQDGDFVYDAEGARGEVVGAVFSSGHDEKVLFGIQKELVDDVRGADPAFAHASKSHDETSFGTALHEVRYVVLEFGGVGETEMFPDDEQEVSKVLELFGNVVHGRGLSNSV